MSAKVTMYCTAVCPYCVRAEALLKQRGVTEIDKIRIDEDPSQRDAMIARTGRRDRARRGRRSRRRGARRRRSAGRCAGGLVPLLAA